MIQTLHVPLPELLQRVHRGEIPLSAQATVTFDDTVLTLQPETVLSPVLALPEPEDNTPLSLEELEDERRLFEQFECNVNGTRTQSAMRTL